MKNNSNIFSLFRYFLVVICFLAISSNLYSFYYGPEIKENTKIESTANDTQEGENEDNTQRYFAYEAVVPIVHFNIIYHFYSIIKVEVCEAPVQIVKTSPPGLFTRPFYRTLFRMIIAPNAP